MNEFKIQSFTYNSEQVYIKFVQMRYGKSVFNLFFY